MSEPPAVDHPQPVPPPRVRRRVWPWLLGLLPAVAVVIVVVLIATSGGDPQLGDNPGAEAEFVSDVEVELFDYTEQDIYDMVDGTLPASKRLPSEQRDALIRAGYAMCDAPSTSDSAEHRRILTEHGLAAYVNGWVFINAAANQNLCDL